MSVSPTQILAAQAKGLINVDSLAASCNEYAFPFFLGCVILQKETGGRNIFGHDKGGALTDPTGKNIEVTEARYLEFLRLIGGGQTSNGVGPAQLTWKGYHIGPQSLTTLGYKAWLPADNIRYAIGRILAPSLKRGLDAGLSLEQAFWNTAKGYNGNASYADDAAVKARTWAATVGTSDMEVDMALTEAEWGRLKAMIEQVVTSPSVLTKIAAGVWTTDGIIPAGDDETDSSNTAWQPQTFLRKTYNRLLKL